MFGTDNHDSKGTRFEILGYLSLYAYSISVFLSFFIWLQLLLRSCLRELSPCSFYTQKNEHYSCHSSTSQIYLFFSNELGADEVIFVSFMTLATLGTFLLLLHTNNKLEQKTYQTSPYFELPSGTLIFVFERCASPIS